MSVAIIDERGDCGAFIVSGVILLLGTEVPLTAAACFIGALAARLPAGDPFPKALKYSSAAAALLVGWGAPEGARGPKAVGTSEK